MRILLDTHILVWCLEENKTLPSKARELILAADEVYASAANIWEMAIKISIGKLNLSVDHHELIQIILKSGFKLLAITPEHAIKTIDLQDHHKNPFDRILIAQSLVEPLHPLTADAAIAKYSLPNIIKA